MNDPFPPGSTAGFAAVIAISGPALDRLAHAQRPPLAPDPLPAGGAVTGRPLERVRLDAPRFALALARRGGLGLRWSGHCLVADADASEPRPMSFEALTQVDARAVLIDGQLGIVVDAADAALISLGSCRWPASSDPQAAPADAPDAALRGLIEQAVRVDLFARGALLPPIDLGGLGALAAEEHAGACLVAVEGALLFGLGIDAGETARQAPALLDFLEGRDVAVWAHPGAVTISAERVRRHVDATISAEGARLLGVSLAVEEGALRVSGTAATPAGHASFAARARPSFLHNGDGAGERFEITLGDFEITVDPAWWARVAGLLGAAEPETVEASLGTTIRHAIGQAISGAIRHGAAPSGGAPPRLRHAAGPSLRIVAFECHAHGLLAAMDVQQAVPGAAAITVARPASGAQPASSAREPREVSAHSNRSTSGIDRGVGETNDTGR